MTTRAMTLKKSDAMQATMASRAEPGFVDLLRLEYLKTSKRFMTRFIVGFLAVGVAGLFGLAYFITIVLGVGEDVPVSDFLMPVTIEDGLEGISFVGSIMMIVLAAGIAGSEYSWGTVRTLAATGVERGRLLAAKLAIIFASSALLVLTGLAAVVVTSTGISLIEGEGLSLGWLSLSMAGDVLLMMARTTFVLAFYGVLGFAIAQVSRSLAAGIAIGIGLLVVEPILTMLIGALGNFGEYADDFSMTINTEVITSLNTFGTPPELAGAPEPWQAAALLTLYAAIAIGVAIVLFRRRDIAID